VFPQKHVLKLVELNSDITDLERH